VTAAPSVRRLDTHGLDVHRLDTHGLDVHRLGVRFFLRDEKHLVNALDLGHRVTAGRGGFRERPRPYW
jgi:hypothetical protein